MIDIHAAQKESIRNWKEKNYTVEQIRLELTDSGLKEDEINDIIKVYQSLQYEKRRRTGFILMGLGAFLGFISCLLTMIDLIPALTGVFLYGFTSLAVIIVIYGCYLVFE
jgi:magnesium-transporting ATPase (P-type)